MNSNLYITGAKPVFEGKERCSTMNQIINIYFDCRLYSFFIKIPDQWINQKISLAWYEFCVAMRAAIEFYSMTSHHYFGFVLSTEHQCKLIIIFALLNSQFLENKEHLFKTFLLPVKIKRRLSA